MLLSKNYSIFSTHFTNSRGFDRLSLLHHTMYIMKIHAYLNEILTEEAAAEGADFSVPVW